MQFNVTTEVARNMAKRLRDAVGGEMLSTGRSYEVLSKTLGLPNWDTLSGVLKAEETGAELERAKLFKAPVLSAPVALYLEARVVDADGVAAAQWARVDLTAAFLGKLALKANQCRIYSDSSVRYYEPVADWDDSVDLNHSEAPMVVTKEDFWFRANPKHASYFVETVRCPIERLFRVLVAGKTDGADFLVEPGAVFYAGDKAESLRETLEEQGRWPEGSASLEGGAL